MHVTKEEVPTYYHVALVGAIVKPGDTLVLPVMAEMIANGDGTKKQDGELTAAKRWLNNHGEEYTWLQPTLLGADGYSREPFCGRYWKREWNGGHHKVYTCRWVIGAPIRYAEQEERALEVHRLELSIWHEGKRKRRFSNSWITDKEIGAEKVQALADWGRARWKIEHEDTNWGTGKLTGARTFV